VPPSPTLCVLAGGVGAARLLRGLQRVVDPTTVTVVVNVGDDDTFHGLHVSPDVDTILYTLSGVTDVERGWGQRDETFECLGALRRLGAADTWFNLGDRDLATHLQRTVRLAAGAPLSTVTAELATALAIEVRLVPATDDPLRTVVVVGDGAGGTRDLRMQEWFVRERSEPPVVALRFDGADTARPGPGVLDAIAAADGIVICPSNPALSIDPVLAVPGVADAVAARRDAVVAVSPIIGGAAVKGPAAQVMAALGHEVSCVGIARWYAPICATLVIDEVDADRADEVAAAGVRPVVAPTLMVGQAESEALARVTLSALEPAR
jgi:LPPG:FO 2-phospho-L-lactate transferase